MKIDNVIAQKCTVLHALCKYSRELPHLNCSIPTTCQNACVLGVIQLQWTEWHVGVTHPSTPTQPPAVLYS